MEAVPPAWEIPLLMDAFENQAKSYAETPAKDSGGT